CSAGHDAPLRRRCEQLLTFVVTRSMRSRGAARAPVVRPSGNALVLEIFVVLLAPLLLVALGRVKLAVEASSILGRLARVMFRLLRRAHNTGSDDEHKDRGDAEDEPREHAAILCRPRATSTTSHGATILPDS